MANQGVHSFLDASTGLLENADMKILTALANDVDVRGPRVLAHEYGWWVNVSTDLFKEILAECRKLGLSEKFERIYRYAHENGCWWINLDADAEMLDLG
ncbi:MAG: hypothetical protein M0036_14160 [Desulfobacteraceae bacterium]|nr:hypothetical protein [Desulfobacteraceae bacterium]